jgi:hypothetical protein
MFEFLLGVAIGLTVGWNLLPQPLWVQRLYSRLTGGGDPESR